MKAKLLKKIRKRFSWFISTSGFPIIVDHKLRRATKIDEKYFREYFNELERDISWLEIDIKEACYRLSKTLMLKPFGFDVGDIRYNKAKKLAERHKNFSNEDK